MHSESAVRGSHSTNRQIDLLVVLSEGFSLLTLSSFMAPFEIVNRLGGRSVFAWRFLSVDGQNVMSNLGVPFPVAGAIDSEIHGRERARLVALVLGGGFAEQPPRRLLSAIRLWHRKGTVLAALDAGPWVLARAGLVTDGNCTIHWHRFPAFAETFPQVTLTEETVAQDKSIWTGAGEAAGFDLGLRLIESLHGADLTSDTAQWALRAQPGYGSSRQPNSAGLRFRHLNNKLADAIELMEQHVEEPLDLVGICGAVQISRRHLERTFRQHVGLTPHRYHLGLRLQRAKGLLQQTSLTLMDISLSCGFATVSHFSKTFRSQYGCSPTRFRKAGTLTTTGKRRCNSQSADVPFES